MQFGTQSSYTNVKEVTMKQNEENNELLIHINNFSFLDDC